MKLVNDMKDKKLYHILLTSLTIIYLFIVYEFNFCTIDYHIIESLVILIPLLICFMIYWLLKKSKIKNGLALVFTIILTISFFMVTFFSFVLLLWDEGTSHENNPWRYNHIKDIADYTSYTYQFPKELSEELLNDREVRFYYTPQFLQGAFQLNLLIELNANEMNKYINQYEGREKVIIDMKKSSENDLQQYVIYGPYGIFKENEYEDFIKDATFYIFESKPYKPDNWNHGVMQYMAKNEKLNRLLLVTEVW